MEEVTEFQAFKNSVRRWYLRTVKGYVILRTYSEYPIDKDGYTDEPYDCKLKIELIKKSELPPEAVHCTGEKGVYCLDLVKRRYKMHDNGFGALDANLYMEFDGFDDALSTKWTDFSHFDTKKFLIICGIVIAVAVFMFLYARASVGGA